MALGSFGAVLVERIPDGHSLWGRSQCTQCKRKLLWWELIPVLSYLGVRGRCRTCGGRIAWWYPVIEGGSALLFMLSVLITNDLFAAIALAMALWTLWIITWIDGRSQTVPDALSVLLLLFALGYGFLSREIDLLAPLLAVVFFGVQWACSRGRILGSGDILVTGASGFLFAHWQGVFLAILVAYVSGAIVCGALLLLGLRKRRDRIAFVPFWFCGVLTALLLQNHPFVSGDMF